MQTREAQGQGQKIQMFCRRHIYMAPYSSKGGQTNVPKKENKLDNCRLDFSFKIESVVSCYIVKVGQRHSRKLCTAKKLLIFLVLGIVFVTGVNNFFGVGDL